MYEQKYIKGKAVLTIFQDECPESPREWDNVGTIVAWHKRYSLGDKEKFSIPEFKEYMKKIPMIVLPVFMYDHSGIALSTNNSQYPFNDQWDSGQLGFIFITLEKVRKEYSVKKVNQKLRKRIIEYLNNEIEIYNQYLSGDVYGYTFKCGEISDSCWGFYGSDWKNNGLLDNIPKEYQDIINYDFPENSITQKEILQEYSQI